MMFLHTLPQILSGQKTQSSRIWKDDYFFPSDYYDKTIYTTLLSHKAWDAGKVRTLYRLGQILSVQPSRGVKGVAKIKILELAKRDVRDFDESDIAREGFPNRTWFLHTWTEMHDKLMHNTLDYAALEAWHEALKTRPAQYYTALVICFELMEVL